MYDLNDLTKIMKQLAVNAYEATKPVNVSFGKVVSVSPLKIQVEQKLTLSKEQLILTRNVTNYKTSISMPSVSTNNSSPKISESLKHDHTVNIDTTTVEDHKHKVSGDTSEVEIKVEATLTHKHTISETTLNVTINNGLKINDEVILLRMQGGQKYLVIDRIGG